jgi:glycerate 2-kinase
VRVLIAPQALKGSLGAAGVAEAIAAGVPPDCDAELLPMADGGEGTVEALLAALGGDRRKSVVDDPLGRPVEAAWAVLAGERAAIEMAAASGLPLLAASERDPRRASTYGTGQLIGEALNSGSSEIIVGLGGSATNDGGAFALQALGARLLDREGKELPRSIIHLQRLQRVDWSGVHPRLSEVRLRVMCDVSNPLLGADGATAVYGPQKGMNDAMWPRLEAALERWADVVEGQLGRRLRDLPGAGAAGGLGFMLLAIGATLEPGADLILDLAGFDERLANANLVITGEGKLDRQSLFGKATISVARRAKKAGVPVLAIVGSAGDGYEAAYKEGIDAVMPLAPGPITLEECQAHAAELVTAATQRAFRMMALGKHASRSRRQ